MNYKKINIDMKKLLVADDTRFSVSHDEDILTLTFKINYRSAYGFGEKFDSVNQAGKIVTTKIVEQCFHQDKLSYCTFPFMMSADAKFGLYLDTLRPVEFDLTDETKIVMKFVHRLGEIIPDIYLFNGTLKEIISLFKEVTSTTKLFPKWVLGAWMSSNRWKNDGDIYEQLEKMEKHQIPHNVLVIENWSDLTTFYNWSGSMAPIISNNEYHHYRDFTFTSASAYKNPQQLIADIHKAGLRVILWEIPVYPTSESVEGTSNFAQRVRDNEEIIMNKECVFNFDLTPYLITKPFWFHGSMIPDFSNKLAVINWFNHRKHLFEIGIDGFKTDGGEFIHQNFTIWSSKLTGLEMKNGYAESYQKAYVENIPEEAIIFSRAGYTNVAHYSLLWGGDQLSTFDEFQSMIKAGISASLSGIAYWGFDISGFSGALPSKELYLRAVQFATFVPLMQWHSDPVCNGGWDPEGKWPCNDRSPWNLSEFYHDEEIISISQRFFYLHYNLIPYFHALAQNAAVTGTPIIRHLAYEFNDDEKVLNLENEFMLGDGILVSTATKINEKKRSIYFPEGEWVRLGTKSFETGNKTISLSVAIEDCVVYLRKNHALSVNLGQEKKLGTKIDNDLSSYINLTFLISGEGEYNFSDDLGNEIAFTWTSNNIVISKNIKNTKIEFIRIEEKGDLVW